MFRIFNPLSWFKPKPAVAAKCGHITEFKGTIRALGDSRIIVLKNTDDYCITCYGNMTVLCAWCGGPIFVGDPITLYTPTSAASFRRSPQQEFEFVHCEELGFNIPKHAVIYNRNPLQLVGCLRMDCAETGGDRMGFWEPGEDGKGRVQRIKSVFEQALESGRGMVINDLSDQSEAERMDLRGDPKINIVREMR